MHTTNVFSRNLKAYNDFSGTDTVIVNQGGQGSSKTISILQVIYLIALSKRKHITIASYALPHLKAGVMRDFDNILMGEDVYPNSVKNISESIYYIGPSTIEFIGVEGNEARATGPRRDILYVNEANKRIKYDVFDLMNSRTTDCTFFDFNPCREFFFHEKIMPSLPYHLIKSTFLDNPYLPDREKQNILSRKDKPGFENWWKVYGEGELGQLEDAILTNWKFGDFDDTLVYGYGLDFGSKHPDAMVKVAVDRDNYKIYVKEEIYKNGLSTEQLIKLIKTKNVDNKLIVADCSAPRTIKDIKGHGINIVPTHGKARIVDDLKNLEDYEIIIDPESFNMEKNINNWIWLDKKGEIPIDENDDLIDAMRYYVRHVVKPANKNNRHKLI